MKSHEKRIKIGSDSSVSSLSLKKPKISENYRIERATIKSRMDEIGIPNHSFAVDFDAQAQLKVFSFSIFFTAYNFKIEPGCRVMYELCKADTVVQIQQNIKIATLEEAVAELYNCIQLAYVLINGKN